MGRKSNPRLMRCIIAGGRDYTLTSDDEAWLDTIGISEVVSGGARGADACGERWASKRNIEVTVFHADWKIFGKSAGPIRNREMAKYAQAVALFPGGKGTENMRHNAVKFGLMIFER